MLSKTLLKRGFASKIVVPTPVVDLDGDEMTRVIWKWIKERHINPYVELKKFVKKNREYGGSKSYETSIGGVRKILQALKLKDAICFAADQVPQRGLGKYIKLYNRDAYTTTLVQSLAVKTGAPVLYTYINSNKDGFLYVSVKQCDNDIYDDSKHQLLLNKDIEKIINVRPIDYSWEYKRFKKHRPPDIDPYRSI